MESDESMSAAAALEEEAFRAADGEDYAKAAELLQQLMDEHGDSLPDETRNQVGWNLGLAYLGSGNIDYGRELLTYYGYSESETAELFEEDDSLSGAADLEVAAYEAACRQDYAKSTALLRQLMDTYAASLPDEARRKLGWNLGLSYFGSGNIDYGCDLLTYYGYSESDITALVKKA